MLTKGETAELSTQPLARTRSARWTLITLDVATVAWMLAVGDRLDRTRPRSDSSHFVRSPSDHPERKMKTPNSRPTLVYEGAVLP